MKLTMTGFDQKGANIVIKETQKQKPFFPVFIDMNGRDVAVIGGGNIADRRIKIMIEFGMKITVIAPAVTGYIEHAASSKKIILLNRKYQKGDISAISPFFVITAADDRQVNRDVMLEAKDLNIPVSVADNKDECSFYFPAIARNENYTAAVVSNNGDHHGVKEKAQKIRDLIDL